jgi:hypothetical protein
VTPPEVLRTCSLITAAALRDDDLSLGLLLNTLHPDAVRAVAIAAVGAMAGLVREACTPEAITQAVHEAQQLAHQAASERTHP